MTSQNKFESKHIDKKFKCKHRSSFPRHQWRSSGDRMKPMSNGCSCCQRQPKEKFITRLKKKKEIKKELKFY